MSRRRVTQARTALTLGAMAIGAWVVLLGAIAGVAALVWWALS